MVIHNRIRTLCETLQNEMHGGDRKIAATSGPKAGPTCQAWIRTASGLKGWTDVPGVDSTNIGPEGWTDMPGRSIGPERLDRRAMCGFDIHRARRQDRHVRTQHRARRLDRRAKRGIRESIGTTQAIINHAAHLLTFGFHSIARRARPPARSTKHSRAETNGGVSILTHKNGSTTAKIVQ